MGIMTDEISDRTLQSYISGHLPKETVKEIEGKSETDANLRARLHNLYLQDCLVRRVFGSGSGMDR